MAVPGRERPGPSAFPDFSRPATREWWGGLYSFFTDIGIAGIWNDMNEPAVFLPPASTMPLSVRHDNEGQPTDHREIHNVYGLLMTRSTHEGLRRLRPRERPFVLTRASFAGGQRYAAVWPGDNVSDWPSLAQSLPTLMGLGLSGFPFVGTDIGGFAETPSAELFTRWLQLGVFHPFMRTHTTFGTPDQEPWSYGTRHEAVNRRAIELRYELLPQVYRVMWEASGTGLPALRPLFLEFPDDPATSEMQDQAMFGSDILIAPVLREATTEREVYLPAGDWYDYWTGRLVSGPRRLRVPVTIESIPIYVRGGAFLFRQPVVQHTGEMAGQRLSVTVYPAPHLRGRVLYEDDGESLDYEQGGFARVASRSGRTGPGAWSRPPPSPARGARRRGCRAAHQDRCRARARSRRSDAARTPVSRYRGPGLERLRRRLRGSRPARPAPGLRGDPGGGDAGVQPSLVAVPAPTGRNHVKTASRSALRGSVKRLSRRARSLCSPQLRSASMSRDRTTSGRRGIPMKQTLKHYLTLCGITAAVAGALVLAGWTLLGRTRPHSGGAGSIPRHPSRRRQSGRTRSIGPSTRWLGTSSRCCSTPQGRSRRPTISRWFRRTSRHIATG